MLPTGYFTGTFRSSLDDSDQPFAAWVPHTYSARKAYPIIITLHGTDAGERMIPEDCFRIHHRGFREDFILLSPFGRGDLWFQRAGETDLWEALSWITSRYRIDARRQYLTGLSMGGYACWRLACRYPEQWAAIAPICGGGDVRQIGALRNIPVWCVHGTDDPYVPVEESRAMIDELRRRRFRHRYDELQHWGHNSWDLLYTPDRREDTLPDWFLQHRKRAKAPGRLLPRRDGTFHDLFAERLVISYPAHTGIPRETEWLQAEAEALARQTAGDHIMRTGHLIVKSDSEVSPEELRGASHLMIGRIDNHAHLKQVRSRLAARHHRGQLRVKGRRHTGDHVVAATVQASPWNRKRLLGTLTYQQFRSVRGIAAHLIPPDAPLKAINVLEARDGGFLPVK